MTLLEILTIFLYGGALIFVIYVIFSLIHKPSAETIIVYDQPPVYQEPIWPWATGPYNWWPYWAGWYSGGGDGGYGRRWEPRWHGGSHRPHGAWGGRPWGSGGRGAHTGGFGGARAGGARGGGGSRR